MPRIPLASDPDIAEIGSMIGDPSRVAMLAALADGCARPAGELARAAEISRSTASAHLEKLMRARLISVEKQGRFRYYRLHGPEVAEMLETLAIVASQAPARTSAQRAAGQMLRFARSCYGHLAGQLGVAVTDALCSQGMLNGAGSSYAITPAGAAWFGALGIDVQALDGDVPAKKCLDWSERRHHLAGALGRALTGRMIALGWLRRTQTPRQLRLTDRGRARLAAELKLSV
jgi:DNA-binding transcriptional ArsR family regulator